MKWILLLNLALCGAAVRSQTATATTTQPLTHVSSTFSFMLNAPMRVVAPLFGPQGERVWAGDDWNPQFIYPATPQDVEGAVFMVRHADHDSVWVNTIFDLEKGRMQYVYVLADLLVTTIDVHLHPVDAQNTKVDVTYTRTALRPEANDHVIAMSGHDRKQGPEWKSKIDAYLLHRNITPARP
jgi:hypothetical protein